jgi:hypothetical protein
MSDGIQRKLIPVVDDEPIVLNVVSTALFAHFKAGARTNVGRRTLMLEKSAVR